MGYFGIIMLIIHIRPIYSKKLRIIMLINKAVILNPVNIWKRENSKPMQIQKFSNINPVMYVY